MSAKSFISVAYIAAVASLSGSVAFAVPLFGGPAYDAISETGYAQWELAECSAADGIIVGNAHKYGGNTNLGQRAVRWDGSGTAATELGNLGTLNGFTYCNARAINDAGTVVGTVNKYTGNTFLGPRAVRWDASGTAATELGNLGVNSIDGSTSSEAIAINASGTVVGRAVKWAGNTSLGVRAVRWNASGTVATELGNLGFENGNYTETHVYAINAPGTAVGQATKFSASGDFLGWRAVRWDAVGTAVTELGTVGDSDSSSYGKALAINNAGTTVGYVIKIANGRSLGDRAVRWNALGTAATELGTLGTDGSGITNCRAYAINATGTAVGYARKFTGGVDLGDRAVRWNGLGTVGIELGNLGVRSDGFTDSRAYSINAAGNAVGYAAKYTAGAYSSQSAVYWGLDGVAIDLNTLLSPADAMLWTLTEARGISDTNWVTGLGYFHSQGPGVLLGYQRAFLIHVPTTIGLTPCDTADVDNNNSVSINDLFSFLALWFAQNGQSGPSLSADIDANGSVSVNDLFAYLALWFQYNGTSC